MKNLSIGQRLKALREAQGWTQSQVAERVGLSQAAYSRWEANMVTRFVPENVERIAKVLGTTKESIMATEDRLDHHKEEIQRWLERPESVEYVKDAYIRYIKEK